MSRAQLDKRLGPRAGIAARPETGDPGPNQGDGKGLRTFDVPAGAFGQKIRWFSGNDLYQLAMLPFLTIIAWLLSDRLCEGYCRGLATLLYRIRPRRYHGYARIFRMLPSGHDAARRIDGLIVEAIAMRQLERLQLLRFHRPGGWNPRVELKGSEHLDRALAAGKGAILWGPHSTFSEVAFKKALHDNGYADWHVARFDHGHFSSTRFGVRFLNPIRIKVEDRYLAERVVIKPTDPTAGLARMVGLLAKNRILSITVQVIANRLTLVPYSEMALTLPGGPPFLSIKTGAPLLPIFTERRPDGSFLVTIEAPLEMAPDTRRGERVEQLLCRQAEIMYTYFQRVPSQYHFAQLLGASERLSRHLTSERA